MFNKAARRVHNYVVPLHFSRSSPGGLVTGTGAIVNRKGLLITADHVVPNENGWGLLAGRNYWGRPPDMFNAKYEAVCRFPELDLAVLRVEGLPLDDLTRPIAFSFSELHYGQPVGSFGYALPITIPDLTLTAQGPQVVGYNTTFMLRFKSYYIAGAGYRGLDIDNPEPGPAKYRDYMLDSFAYPGHSGGPVFDPEGNVFAVMRASHLHPKKQHEISYCEASAVSNIADVLRSL